MAEQKAKEEAAKAEARRRHDEEAAARSGAQKAAARAAARASAASPGAPSEEEVLAMLRNLAAAKAPALSSEACPCGAPYVQGAKFCSEGGAERPVQEGSEPN